MENLNSIKSLMSNWLLIIAGAGLEIPTNSAEAEPHFVLLSNSNNHLEMQHEFFESTV